MRRALIFVLLLGATAAAQIRGVPPSVTSQVPGPDGITIPRGVPASVTSLGPEGFGPPLVTPHIPRAVLPVFFPAYVPVPYVVIERERIIEREIRTEVAAHDDREEQADEPRRESRRRGSAEEEDTPAPIAAPEPAPLPDAAPTLLIFRDGRRAEVRNYAILGDELFVFAPDPQRKLLLADLDLDATRAANEARGLAFVVP